MITCFLDSAWNPSILSLSYFWFCVKVECVLSGGIIGCCHTELSETHVREIYLRKFKESEVGEVKITNSLCKKSTIHQVALGR